MKPSGVAHASDSSTLSMPKRKLSVMAAEGISRANTRPLLVLVLPQLKSFHISDHSGATGMSYSEARGRALVLLQGMLYGSCDWNRVSVFKEIGKGSGIASWTDQSAVEC